MGIEIAVAVYVNVFGVENFADCAGTVIKESLTVRRVNFAVAVKVVVLRGSLVGNNKAEKTRAYKCGVNKVKVQRHIRQIEINSKFKVISRILISLRGFYGCKAGPAEIICIGVYFHALSAVGNTDAQFAYVKESYGFGIVEGKGEHNTCSVVVAVENAVLVTGQCNRVGNGSYFGNLTGKLVYSYKRIIVCYAVNLFILRIKCHIVYADSKIGDPYIGVNVVLGHYK